MRMTRPDGYQGDFERTNAKLINIALSRTTLLEKLTLLPNHIEIKRKN